MAARGIRCVPVSDATLSETLSSLTLLARARAGDNDALEALIARVRPRLRRWASGRLPGWARDVADTDDLLQDTLVSTMRNLDGFTPNHEAALSAYLRQTFMNRVRDEIRRVGRRPAHDGLDRAQHVASADQSVLLTLVGRDDYTRYEAALLRLTPSEREAVIGRLELHYSFQDLADALGKPSADAARKFVQRAVVHLAELMGADG
jgi:RNA polymerase sigma-70 factor (ECF subfamily)